MYNSRKTSKIETFKLVFVIFFLIVCLKNPFFSQEVPLKHYTN